MLFTALSAVSVAAVALANPILEGRAPAAVYSSCTVPNTVALTFVSVLIGSCCFVQLIEYLPGRWTLLVAVGSFVRLISTCN